MYDEVVLTPEADETLDDSEKDAIYQEYEYCGGDAIYVHCHTIDAMIEANKPYTVHHYGRTNVSYDESDHENQMEGLGNTSPATTICRRPSGRTNIVKSLRRAIRDNQRFCKYERLLRWIRLHVFQYEDDGELEKAQIA